MTEDVQLSRVTAQSVGTAAGKGRHSLGTTLSMLITSSSDAWPRQSLLCLAALGAMAVSWTTQPRLSSSPSSMGGIILGSVSVENLGPEMPQAQDCGQLGFEPAWCTVYYRHD
eukprot:7386957-Prymnesium_polylepis.1